LLLYRSKEALLDDTRLLDSLIYPAFKLTSLRRFILSLYFLYDCTLYIVHCLYKFTAVFDFLTMSPSNGAASLRSLL
jgi:hypothetical protein